jgi:hydroxyacylglutathione hydrolase
VCCAHEYTVGNLRFANAVEPGNRDVAEYLDRCLALRARDEPTLPSSIKQERLVNPFLRCQKPAVVGAARRMAAAGHAMDDVAVFAALRAWKDRFA